MDILYEGNMFIFVHISQVNTKNRRNCYITLPSMSHEKQTETLAAFWLQWKEVSVCINSHSVGHSILFLVSLSLASFFQNPQRNSVII